MCRARRAVVVAALAALVPCSQLHAGPLDPPPGPIASTPKPLAELEPRIAINSTNTPGDAISVFRIPGCGSYYLTSNVAGQPGKHAIFAPAFPGGGEVTIDLNGFTLTGVPGSLNGVNAAGTVNVRNGAANLWGGAGISVSRGILRDLHVSTNAGHGLVANWGVVISHCVAEGNGANGIHVSDVSRIESCVSKVNTGEGIHLDGAGTVADCVVYNNAAGGIIAGLASQVTDGTVFSVPTDAIRVSHGSSVARNSIASAGVGVRVTGDACRIEANSVVFGVVGIRIESAGSRVEGNSVSRGGTGISVSPGVGNIIVRNTCSGNTTNWDVVAGNICLVVQAAVSGAVSGNAGGVPLGSTDPNANFTH